MSTFRLWQKRIVAAWHRGLFIRFVVTGAGGALLSLCVTWVLVRLVFGEAHYFGAYAIGIAVNLAFNFALYTVAVFKTKYDHWRRLCLFLFYGVIMAFLQGATVRLITAQIGTSRYLLTIAAVIAAFAVLNFFVFKFSIFKEYEPGVRAPAREVVAFIIVCSVLLHVGVLFNALSLHGVDPLVYGDALGYRENAMHLMAGEGFSLVKQGVLVPDVFRTPGLPLLMAPFAATDWGLTVYLFLLTVTAAILLPYFTYVFARRFVPVGPALLTVALVAFEPHFIFYSALPLSEIPFMLFGYGGFVAALRAYDRRSWLDASLAGALLGYAILIRPGFLPVFAGALALVFIYAYGRHRATVRVLVVLTVMMGVVLAPWFIRTHSLTGVYTLSGVGWRNVYTNYLASVRSIERHTEFSTEKTALIQHADQAGIAPSAINAPESVPRLRAFALNELWQKKRIVAVLEPTLLASYFFNDGYYFEFQRFALVPADTDVRHTSATAAVLTHGFAGLRTAFDELARQRFTPIVGRLFTLATFVFAVIGFFRMRGRSRFLLAFVIILSALTATAIGLGVESRLRLPIEPLLFLFAASACAGLFPRIRWLHDSRPH